MESHFKSKGGSQKYIDKIMICARLTDKSIVLIFNEVCRQGVVFLYVRYLCFSHPVQRRMRMVQQRRWVVQLSL